MKRRRDYKYVEYPEVGTIFFEKSKRAKRVIIAVKSPTFIRVAVPRFVTIKKAESFVYQKLDWIKKQQIKISKRTNVSNRLEVTSKEEKEALIERVKYLADKYEFRYGKIALRKMKTRWGSCSTENNISLNSGLMVLPDELRDYVILHELVHTTIKNHSKQFWHELGKVVEQPKALASTLRKQFGIYGV